MKGNEIILFFTLAILGIVFFYYSIKFEYLGVSSNVFLFLYAGTLLSFCIYPLFFDSYYKFLCWFAFFTHFVLWLSENTIREKLFKDDKNVGKLDKDGFTYY
jgi:hypothetical protein